MKTQYSHKGIQYDSQEEVEFILWLECAAEVGLVIKYEYQPTAFLLSKKVVIPVFKHLKTKTVTKEKTLLQEHVYTPDFKIWFNDGFLHQYCPNHGLVADISDKEQGFAVFVDVKGTFNQNDAWRRFSIDQKWVFQRYEIFVNKVIPERFFQLTFVPDEIAVTKRDVNKRIKRFAKCKLFSEIAS